MTMELGRTSFDDLEVEDASVAPSGNVTLGERRVGRMGAVVVGAAVMVGGLWFTGRSSPESSQNTTAAPLPVASTTIPAGTPSASTSVPGVVETTTPDASFDVFGSSDGRQLSFGCCSPPKIDVLGSLVDEPTGLSFVVLFTDLRLRRLDLDTGTLTTISDQVGTSDYGQVFAAADGSTVMALLDTNLYFAPDGFDMALGPYRYPIDVQFSDHLWTLSSDGLTQTLEELLPDGTVGRGLVLGPTNQVQYVRGERVIVSGSNGIDSFALEPPDWRPRRITTGQLLFADAKRAVVTECDDVMQCSIAAVDLASGHHEPLRALDASRYFGQPVALSPDGSLLAFVNEHSLLEVVDVGSGETVLTDRIIGQSRGPARIIWSDDGKWLTVSDVGSLLLWRRGWTELHPIDLPGALSFALAPAAS